MPGLDLSFWGFMVGWVIGPGLRIGLIVAMALAAYQFAKRAIPKVMVAAVGKGLPEQSSEEVAKRADTLAHVVTKTVAVVIVIAALFTVLDQVGISISPVLAGVGVAGIAIGFGAQSLVRDILNGPFIILDNQFGKGDVVSIAGIAGLVEEVNLRRTVLRDL